MPSQDWDGIGISIALMYSTGASFCVGNEIDDGRISPASNAEKAARDTTKHVTDTSHRYHGHFEAFFGHRSRYTQAMHNTSSQHSVRRLNPFRIEKLDEVDLSNY